MILSTWTRSWKEFGESSAKHPNSWSIACTVLDKAVRFNLWTSFVQLNNSREKAILNTKDSSVSVGVQNGTTGQLYCEGDEEWEFAGFQMTTKNYKNGSLAVLDLLNGNLDYVVIDAAPAKFITESINAMQ